MMHRYALTALLATATLTAQNAIQWEPDLATAHEKSRQTGKPVLAYFTFDT